LIKKSENQYLTRLRYEIKTISESSYQNKFMKNELTQTKVALHLMVSRISASSLTSASRKNSFIINDVPADLQAHTDENMLAAVLGSLLNTVITHTENCCIRISAKLYGRVVLLQLKETHQFHSHALAVNLKQVQQLAEKIGGTISVSNNCREASTIVFSFVNNFPLAA
jgi:anaerobic glycerol-3-phosphate dehydrogenase